MATAACPKEALDRPPVSTIHAMMACAHPKLQVRLGENQMPTCLVAPKVALDRWWEACRASEREVLDTSSNLNLSILYLLAGIFQNRNNSRRNHTTADAGLRGTEGGFRLLEGLYSQLAKV